jgi:hypothetical protein
MCRYPDKSVLLFPPLLLSLTSLSSLHVNLDLNVVHTPGLHSSTLGMLAMLKVSLWLLRLGRELVGDVLRVFPSLGHESKKTKQERWSAGPVITSHAGKVGYSLGMAAPGNELFLFVREAD